MLVTTRRTLVVLATFFALVVGLGVAPASAATQTLTVTVVDPVTKQPVTAYRTCVSAEPVSGATPTRACTNASGTAVFQLDDTVQYRLVTRVVPANSGYLLGYYYGGTQVPATGTVVQPPATVTFPLTLGATAKGTLTFPNGQPASGYTVTVRSQDTSISTTTATTGIDGIWSSSQALAPGRYTVEFSGPAGTSWAYGKTTAETASILDFVGGPNVVNDSLVPPAGGFPVPVLTVPTSPVLVEAAGPSGTVYDYTGLVSAITADGGAAPVSCNPVADIMFPFGDTTVSCTASDPSTGISTSGRFTVRVADTVGPSLSVSQPVTAVATGANGAVVSFAAPAAFDTVDGAVPATCDHAYTALFPVGVTTVSCSAADSHGNVSTAIFTVTVVPNQADLQVTVTAPATVAKHATGTWRLTVVNHGPATATDVRAALDAQGLTVIATSPATKTGRVQVGGTALAGPTWSIATLAAGASATFEVTATPTASRAGTLSVIGGAVSSVPDPVPADNIGRVSTTVTK